MFKFTTDWPDAAALYLASTGGHVSSKTFFCSSDLQVIKLIGESYPEELSRLKRAYSIRDRTFTCATTPSPFMTLFDKEYDEVNRTMTSILSLRWLYNNDYDSFVRSQPEATRLKRGSFDWLRGRLADALSEPTDLNTLITLVLINDLGKVDQLVMDLISRTGDDDILALNHDAILFRAAEAGIVPCLAAVSPKQHDQIIQILRAGSEFNYGQFAQAESAPVCITKLREVKDKHVFDLHFAEQILDVSGAKGHMNWTCATIMVEPILDAYRSVYDAGLSVMSNQLNPQSAWNIILERRALMLEAQGFRRLSLKKPNERALMRLLCLGGVVDLETAKLYDEVWNQQGGVSNLVNRLNVANEETTIVVQPTYMPALLAQALGGEGPGGGRPKTRLEKCATLESAFRYLDRVMNAGLENWMGDPTKLVERNVLHVVRGVIQGPAFRDNPSVLDTVDVPDPVVLCV